MYGWIFSKLPGPLWAKQLQVLAALIVAVVVCMLWVYPWLSEHSPLGDVAFDDDDVTVEEE